MRQNTQKKMNRKKSRNRHTTMPGKLNTATASHVDKLPIHTMCIYSKSGFFTA